MDGASCTESLRMIQIPGVQPQYCKPDVWLRSWSEREKRSGEEVECSQQKEGRTEY